MANPSENNGAGGRLSEGEVARLSGQIASVAAAGLPLGPGLLATAEEMPPGRLRSTLRRIAGALERGASVAEAVRSEGDRLPKHLQGLVLAGTRTGKVSEVLGRFVAFANVGVELRRGLFLSLAYPLMAVWVAFGVFVYICTSLVGSFRQIFMDFGIPIPVITQALIVVAGLFSAGWPSVVEGFVAVAALWLLARVFLSTPFRRSLASGIPVVGWVWRNTALAEFCHLLGLLLESDVPLDESLRLAGGGVGNASIGRVCGAMAADVAGGMSLADAVARRPVFPRGLPRVLRWAEGHQSLPEALRMAGEMFEARARSQASLAGTVFNVLAFLTILFGVSSIVVGLLLPMVTLISKLAG